MDLCMEMNKEIFELIFSQGLFDWFEITDGRSDAQHVYLTLTEKDLPPLSNAQYPQKMDHTENMVLPTQLRTFSVGDHLPCGGGTGNPWVFSVSLRKGGRGRGGLRQGLCATRPAWPKRHGRKCPLLLFPTLEIRKHRRPATCVHPDRVIPEVCNRESRFVF